MPLKVNTLVVISWLKYLFLATSPSTPLPYRPSCHCPAPFPILFHSGLVIAELHATHPLHSSLTWSPPRTTGIQGPWQPQIFPPTSLQTLKSKKVLRSYLKIVLSIKQGFNFFELDDRCFIGLFFKTDTFRFFSMIYIFRKFYKELQVVYLREYCHCSHLRNSSYYSHWSHSNHYISKKTMSPL